MIAATIPPAAAIPPTGTREIGITFKHIERGLDYRRGLRHFVDPSISRLYDKGFEPFGEVEGFHFTTIEPRPEDVDQLRQFCHEQSAFKMRGVFSWEVGEWRQLLTCHGVRIGFRTNALAIRARMTFSKSIGIL